MSKKSIYRSTLVVVIVLSVFCFSFVNTSTNAEALKLKVLPNQEIKSETGEQEKNNKQLHVPDITLLKRALALLENLVKYY